MSKLSSIITTITNSNLNNTHDNIQHLNDHHQTHEHVPNIIPAKGNIISNDRQPQE
jgi:hypothetical protein